MGKAKSHISKFSRKGHVRRFIIKLIFRGAKVRCNICGENFKRFSKDRITHRAGSRCPNCGSLESTRIVWLYLSNEVLGKKNKNRFLYFSPEEPILEKMKHYNIELDVADRNYFDMIVDQDLEKLPGSKFDVIIFSHQLQYIKDEMAVFNELKRLLRPGGFIIMITLVKWDMERTYENPVTDEDKSRLLDCYEPGLERVYGADFAKRLVKAGFEVETVDYADQLGAAAHAYYSLGSGNREIIFKCKKSS